MKQRASRAAFLGVDLKIESSVDESLRTLLLSDLVLLRETPVIGDRNFRASFGGGSAADVSAYIGERLHYVLPAQPDSSLVQKFAAVGGSKIRVIATNISLPVWDYALRTPGLQGYFEFDQYWIPVHGLRVGIMMLGEGYHPNYPEVARMATLVHEARHSDCPNGLPSEYLQSEHDGSGRSLKLLAQCGHIHSYCPSDHNFAGYQACDSTPWGAYSMGMIYLSAVGRSCAGCTEEARQISLAQASDSASRLLFNVEGMLSGQYGEPNMASIPQVTTKK